MNILSGQGETLVHLSLCRTISLLKNKKQMLGFVASLVIGSTVIGFAFYYVLIWPDGVSNPKEARKERFWRAGAEAQPIIDAIEMFVQKRGVAPKSLQELTPEFLLKIPDTGLVDHTQFEMWNVTEKYASHTPWELRINCSHGASNWDVFFYWPTQAYPDRIYDGTTEILGKWCYVWE